MRNIYELSNFSFDANIDFWIQPEIQFGKNPIVTKGGGFGGACSTRGYYNFPNSRLPVSAVLELGYKSVGFLEGYVLDSFPIVMVGLALKR